MTIDINITLIVVVSVIALMALHGFKRGMTKEISGFISLIVTLIVISLLIMLYRSVIGSHIRNTVYSVLILLAIALVYGIVKMILGSVRLLSKLPVINVLDRLLGIVVGGGEGVLIVWILHIVLQVGILGETANLIYLDIAESRFLSTLCHYNYLSKLAELF